MAWPVVRNPVGVVAALLLTSFFGVVLAQSPAPDPKAAANAARAQQDRIRVLEDQVRTQQERIRTLEERTRTALADAEAERKRADAIVQFANRRIAEEIEGAKRSVQQSTVDLEQLRYEFQRNVGLLQEVVAATLKREADAARERWLWIGGALLLGALGGALGMWKLQPRAPAEDDQLVALTAESIADLVDLPADYRGATGGGAVPAAIALANSGDLNASAAR